MFQNLEIQFPVGISSGDDDDEIELRKDWIVHVNVPRRIDKIKDKLNEAIQKGGYRKHCTLATKIIGPHNTPALTLNTYKRVAVRIALLKYITCIEVM